MYVTIQLAENEVLECQNNCVCVTDSEVGGNHTQSNRNRITATLGLVVHAAGE